MATVDTSKRLRNSIIQDDIKALQGAKGLPNYTPFRSEARTDLLSDLESKMRFAQEAELQAKAQYQAAQNTAQELEWKFHNAILTLKQSVIAQYGDDGNEVEAIGLQKKSDRKRPQRKAKVAQPA
jgi:hypothetical protein